MLQQKNLYEKCSRGSAPAIGSLYLNYGLDIEILEPPANENHRNDTQHIDIHQYNKKLRH